MNHLFTRLTFIFVVGIAVSCQPNKKDEKIDLVRFDLVQDYVVQHLTQSISLLDQVYREDNPEVKVETFKKARLAFKMAEPFAAYLQPENALRANGPPLPVFRENNAKVLPPIGLQAIEETLYADDLDTVALFYQIDITKGFINSLAEMAEKHEINPRRFFAPIHQQFLRIYALGLSGFDTPTSLLGIDESAVCIDGIREVYSMSIADTIKTLDINLHNDFINSLSETEEYLKENRDFNTFDRYEFGREYLNDLTKNWVEIRKTFGYEDPKNFALNLDAPTLFETNSFNLDFFRSSANRFPEEEEVLLGKKLFSDPSLSEGKLSCASCHPASKSYQDGLTLAVGNDGKELTRNTPTLVNSVLQKKFFWDGRADNLEQQITGVFNNDKEFATNVHAISLEKIANQEEYKELFKAAYEGKRSINRKTIIRALSSFVSTLNGFDSRFDKNMRGELSDFTDQEILGMNLYMGKALCATCHFVPLTNGTVPPLFGDTEKEVIGVPETAENKEVDNDLGFYWVYEQAMHKFMFKTPTVRNSELTAPYMHNGVYENLEQVMDFYNKGGGGGMGFDLEHQTLPFDSLSLNQEELDALVVFMKTFTDTPDAPKKEKDEVVSLIK